VRRWATLRLSVTLCVAAAGCLPSGGPAEGSLRGRFGARAVDLTLDADSLYWLQRRASCATHNQDIYALHYGAGDIEIYFQIDGGTSILYDRSFDVPQPAGSALVWFSMSPGAPALATAHLEATISGVITTRRTGTIAMTFDDGGTLDAVYSMPYEVQGARTSCGDGGDWPDD
jgi:hypothetical protein